MGLAVLFRAGNLPAADNLVHRVAIRFSPGSRLNRLPKTATGAFAPPPDFEPEGPFAPQRFGFSTPEILVCWPDSNPSPFPMRQLLECVPNFSEGRDPAIIRQITDEIQSVEGVKLLNVDPGKATNRTVVTFVGEPAAVCEAAFRAIRKAGEIIDMSRHQGEHPRMGATDVCPLVPIAGITMEETAAHARQLAERVGRELNLPVYLYEAAQPNPARRSLSVIRAGEYEGFAKKILLPEWKPDFGPAAFDARRGATVIGARDFLVAYNVNLNTTSTRRANAVAFDIR